MFSSFMTSFIHRRKFTVVIQKKALFWGRIGCRGHFMEFLRICKEIKFEKINQRNTKENIGGNLSVVYTYLNFDTFFCKNVVLILKKRTGFGAHAIT